MKSPSIQTQPRTGLVLLAELLLAVFLIVLLCLIGQWNDIHVA